MTLIQSPDFTWGYNTFTLEDADTCWDCLKAMAREWSRTIQDKDDLGRAALVARMGDTCGDALLAAIIKQRDEYDRILREIDDFCGRVYSFMEEKGWA